MADREVRIRRLLAEGKSVLLVGGEPMLGAWHGSSLAYQELRQLARHGNVVWVARLDDIDILAARAFAQRIDQDAPPPAGKAAT